MAILTLIRTAPAIDPEPLELVMALAAFERPPVVVFAGRGLGWLNPQASALVAGGKAPAKLLRSLPMYDCERIYYLDTDVAPHVRKQLSPLASPIDAVQLQQLIAQAEHCLSF